MSRIYEYALSKLVLDNNIDLDTKLSMVCELINIAGPNFNINYGQSKILIYAVENNIYPLVKLLLEHGSDATVRDNYCIVISCRYDENIDIINILLKYGADATAQYNRPIVNMCSKEDLHIDIIKLLIDYGADPLACRNEPISRARCLDVVKYLIELGADPFSWDNRLLCKSCENSKLSLVTYLVEIGADCTVPNNLPISATFTYNVNPKIAKILLDNGADVNYICDEECLLERAICNCDFDGCEILLAYGADVELCNIKKNQQLNYDYVHGGQEIKKIVDLLKSYGLDISDIVY
jgi:ankyrin repeat protein